jgi:hypothetical protein
VTPYFEKPKAANGSEQLLSLSTIPSGKSLYYSIRKEQEGRLRLWLPVRKANQPEGGLHFLKKYLLLQT